MLIFVYREVLPKIRNKIPQSLSLAPSSALRLLLARATILRHLMVQGIPLSKLGQLANSVIVSVRYLIVSE